jgi:hypothetical protein
MKGEENSMQNPITEKQREQIRKIINKMGYAEFRRWLEMNEPDIHPDYITCGQAQRILNKLSVVQPQTTAGKIEISGRFVNLNLYRNKDGNVIALHLCNSNGEHQAMGDPRFCPAWRRIEEGLWRPRHMKAYGRICTTCGKYMPPDVMLEAAYHNAEIDGLDKLELMEI